MSRLMLSILGGVAKFERSLIRARERASNFCDLQKFLSTMCNSDATFLLHLAGGRSERGGHHVQRIWNTLRSRAGTLSQIRDANIMKPRMTQLTMGCGKR